LDRIVYDASMKPVSERMLDVDTVVMLLRDLVDTLMFEMSDVMADVEIVVMFDKVELVMFMTPCEGFAMLSTVIILTLLRVRADMLMLGVSDVNFTRDTVSTFDRLRVDKLMF
jgi:hypothetical protein